MSWQDILKNDPDAERKKFMESLQRQMMRQYNIGPDDANPFTLYGEDYYDWEDSFSKFGFVDGADKQYSNQVIDFLEGKGYKVSNISRSAHNDYIVKITKDNKEIYNQGEDIPQEIKELLDNEFSDGFEKGDEK